MLNSIYVHAYVFGTLLKVNRVRIMFVKVRSQKERVYMLGKFNVVGLGARAYAGFRFECYEYNIII